MVGTRQKAKLNRQRCSSFATDAHVPVWRLNRELTDSALARLSCMIAHWFSRHSRSGMCAWWTECSAWEPPEKFSQIRLFWYTIIRIAIRDRCYSSSACVVQWECPALGLNSFECVRLVPPIRPVGKVKCDKSGATDKWLIINEGPMVLSIRTASIRLECET